jgi:hypothetical protein
VFYLLSCRVTEGVIREEHYGALLANPDLHVKLTGSWETTVGTLDTFGVYSYDYQALSFGLISVFKCIS